MPGSSYRITRFQQGDVDLAVHWWVPEKPSAFFYYLHGLRSHAGWFYETGPALAARGVAFVATDRRGSGKSSGQRGDAEAFERWVDDEVAAFTMAREQFPDVPVTLAGQSLGGSIVVPVARRVRGAFDAVLLSSPGLNQMRGRLPPERQTLIKTRRDQIYRVISLQNEWYTNDAAYLSFIERDPLLLREMTGRMLACAYDLEEHYMLEPGVWLPEPSLLLLARDDRSSNVAVMREAFNTLTAGKGAVLELPTEEHYLEFSRCRHMAWSVMADFALTAGWTRPAPGSVQGDLSSEPG